MKRSLAFLILFIFSACVLLQAQTPRNFKKEAAELKALLDRKHYRPPVLNDQFSLNVWWELLNHVDPHRLYFTTQDLTPLNSFRNLLDDEWMGRGWEFLAQFTSSYRNALMRGKTILSGEIEQPISWQSDEVFSPGGSDTDWPKNESDLRKRWRLWIKYRTLEQIQEEASKDSTASDKGLAFIVAREKVLKQLVLKSENRRAKRILENPNGFENQVAAIYFRAVAAYYDPHSLYLSPQEVEIFKGAMSTKTYSFGLGFGEDQFGNVLIEHLIPGGPAWKSGELHQGDVLTECQWQGQSGFDLTGIGLEEFVELLDRANPSSLELTVKQSTGLKKTVSLKKERIESEDNTVKGFVLKGLRKIGFISLPGFYTQWESGEISSCANDVASEIIKLKGEDISGLILDIRSNGGGSLKEAIEMAGIFIDEGPLTVLAGKSGKTTILKDLNRGTVYDGPLVILIDGQSASASEILAGAIQDYRRGIIVGGNSFGKATAQTLMPLDSVQSDKATSPGSGYATVTQQRIYRVTGKSNQGVGVQPDIKLPDLYDRPSFHEMALPRAFVRDSLTRKIIYRPLPELPLAVLRKQSITRLAEGSKFKNILDVQEVLAEAETESAVGEKLKWQDYLGKESADHARENKPTTIYDVGFPEFNRKRIEIDPYLKEYMQLWAKNLKEDPYVEEAFLIICDYLQSHK
jgi:carboxyl-terminal processing protease